MEKNDFVYTLNKDGTVQSGGYKIDSILLSNTDSFLNVKNSDCTQKQIGGINNSNKILENLGVPAGLVTINGGQSEIRTKTVSNDFLNDTLYSKLIGLSSGINNSEKKISKSSNKKSRKQRMQKTKKTRKANKN